MTFRNAGPRDARWSADAVLAIVRDVDRGEVEAWVRSRVAVAGAIEVAHERPWASVLRVPVADGCVWFKACGAVQAFEPRLSAELFARWPDRVAEVLGYDTERGWLLLADAGEPMADGNPPEPLLRLLPQYAELQRGEALHAVDPLAHGVPDLRVARVPERYDDLLRHDLPLKPEEISRLRAFAARLESFATSLRRMAYRRRFSTTTYI